MHKHYSPMHYTQEEIVMENKLKQLRLAAGLSQSQLAEKPEVPLRAIQAMDQGYRDIKKRKD